MSGISLIELAATITAIFGAITGGATAWLRLFISNAINGSRDALIEHIDERFVTKEVVDERFKSHAKDIDRLTRHVFNGN